MVLSRQTGDAVQSERLRHHKQIFQINDDIVQLQLQHNARMSMSEVEDAKEDADDPSIPAAMAASISHSRSIDQDAASRSVASKGAAGRHSLRQKLLLSHDPSVNSLGGMSAQLAEASVSSIDSSAQQQTILSAGTAGAKRFTNPERDARALAEKLVEPYLASLTQEDEESDEEEERKEQEELAAAEAARRKAEQVETVFAFMSDEAIAAKIKIYQRAALDITNEMKLRRAQGKEALGLDSVSILPTREEAAEQASGHTSPTHAQDSLLLEKYRKAKAIELRAAVAMEQASEVPSSLSPLKRQKSLNRKKSAAPRTSLGGMMKVSAAVMKMKGRLGVTEAEAQEVKDSMRAEFLGQQAAKGEERERREVRRYRKNWRAVKSFSEHQPLRDVSVLMRGTPYYYDLDKSLKQALEVVNKMELIESGMHSPPKDINNLPPSPKMTPGYSSYAHRKWKEEEKSDSEESADTVFMVDEELNSDAYELARRLDTVYLVGQFDVTNHMDLCQRCKINIKDSANVTVYSGEQNYLLRSFDTLESNKAGRPLLGLKVASTDSAFVSPQISPLTRNAIPFADFPDLEGEGSPIGEPAAAAPQEDEIDFEELKRLQEEREEEEEEKALAARIWYEQESDIMMELLLDGLPPELAAKIRRGFEKQAEKLRNAKMLAFINRHRNATLLTADETDKILAYYDQLNEFGWYSDSDNSSSDSDDDDSSLEIDDICDLLGDYVDPALVQEVIQQRVEEDAMIRSMARRKRGGTKFITRKPREKALKSQHADKRLSQAKPRLAIDPEEYWKLMESFRANGRMNLAALKHAMMQMNLELKKITLQKANLEFGIKPESRSSSPVAKTPEERRRSSVKPIEYHAKAPVGAFWGVFPGVAEMEEAMAIIPPAESSMPRRRSTVTDRKKSVSSVSEARRRSRQAHSPMDMSRRHSRTPSPAKHGSAPHEASIDEVDSLLDDHLRNFYSRGFNDSSECSAENYVHPRLTVVNLDLQCQVPMMMDRAAAAAEGGGRRKSTRDEPKQRTFSVDSENDADSIGPEQPSPARAEKRKSGRLRPHSHDSQSSKLREVALDPIGEKDVAVEPLAEGDVEDSDMHAAVADSMEEAQELKGSVAEAAEQDPFDINSLIDQMLVADVVGKGGKHAPQKDSLVSFSSPRKRIHALHLPVPAPAASSLVTADVSLITTENDEDTINGVLQRSSLTVTPLSPQLQHGERKKVQQKAEQEKLRKLTRELNQTADSFRDLKVIGHHSKEIPLKPAIKRSIQEQGSVLPVFEQLLQEEYAIHALEHSSGSSSLSVDQSNANRQANALQFNDTMALNELKLPLLPKHTRLK